MLIFMEWLVFKKKYFDGTMTKSDMGAFYIQSNRVMMSTTKPDPHTSSS